MGYALCVALPSKIVTEIRGAVLFIEKIKTVTFVITMRFFF